MNRFQPYIIKLYTYLFFLIACVEILLGALSNNEIEIRLLVVLVYFFCSLSSLRLDFFSKHYQKFYLISSSILILQKYYLLILNPNDIINIFSLYFTSLFIILLCNYRFHELILSLITLILYLILPKQSEIFIYYLMSTLFMILIIKYYLLKMVNNYDKHSQINQKNIELQTAISTINTLSHDVNNSLQSIAFRVELAEINKEDKDSIKHNLNNIKESLNIIKKYKKLSEDKYHLYIKDLIDNIIENQKDILDNKNIKMISNIDKDIKTVGLDINAIKKVLEALIENAIYELSKGHTKKPCLKIKGYINIDDQIIIEVQDNANTLSDQDKETIFGLFTSTKQIQEGKGVGLTMAREMIEEMKGSLFVSSTNPTCFKIILPNHE